MKRLLLFLSIVFFIVSGQTLASDRKFAHGAATLPHLTSVFTLNGGFEIPIPLFYDLQFNIGLGNHVQLELSAYIVPA
jgi:hypothetical protein